MVEDYFLGLDCGTGSVGWAVTDESYHILRKKGKSLWGSRLFETANTAEERRGFRTARRRTYRKKVRFDLLNEFFEDEINKIDPDFFQRLKESKYYLDDKNLHDKNTLFNDKNYCDIHYNKAYPTIYHLRKELIQNEKPHDIRLVYLTIHHILKHRGHFLFENQNFESTPVIVPSFNELKETLQDAANINISYPQGIEAITSLLKNHHIHYKAKELAKLIEVSHEDNKIAKKISAEIGKAINGNKTDLSILFNDEDLKQLEYPKFELSNATYEDHEEAIQSEIGEDLFQVITILKRIYDWSLLDEILLGEKYLSFAKVKTYEQHKKDLKELKSLVKKYVPQAYAQAFHDTTIKNNYTAYIGHDLVKGKKDTGTKAKCSKEEVNKYFRTLFKKVKPEKTNDYLLTELLKRLDVNKLLPKARIDSNRTIPYQLNLIELKAILKNAETYLPFLSQKDEDGYSISQKIIAIMEFRIPYYVGPLVENTGSGEDFQKYCWMIRKDKGGRILPWKFDKQIDLPACSNAFIRRMTRKCTYLPAENVLPKNSLLYSEFSLLNELNNIKVNGQNLPILLKEKLFELFKKKKTVTIKGIKSFLKAEGLIKANEDPEISGIDISIKSNLKAYRDFSQYLNKGILEKEEIEEIIEWATIFSEGQGLLEQKINEKYKTKLSEEAIKDIVKKSSSYSGWGNLSKKLLTEMYDVNKSTGECKSIITLMHETNKNLMELLSNDFSISESIEEERKIHEKAYQWSYESLVEPLIVSPSVKRSIWQTLNIVQEIVNVNKKDPKKIFIEMARKKGKKGERTLSRKKTMREKLQNLTENPDAMSLLSSLEHETDDSLRKDKLYLYYTQLGRCLYSGSKINLSDLLSNSKHYDIDHIYPQSKVKDNSYDNRVLVLSTENGKKGNNYPIDPKIQEKQTKFWHLLRTNNLISKEKYARLIRTSGFSKGELETFIARQIVETRQSTKEVGRILKRMCPNTDIVYSKARNVTDFRNQFELHKARMLNDLHHAKDAYLNIVVGNVYHTKFTNDPKNIFKNNEVKESYNLGKLFLYNISKYGVFAWRKDTNRNIRIRNKEAEKVSPETGTIVTVRKYINRNDILLTRQTFIQKGGISDQMIVKHGANKGVIPIKSSDTKLSDVEKYGGYNKVARAYFIVVEYTEKGKREKAFFDVPIYLKSKIDNGTLTLENYCTDTLQLKEPIVIIPKVLINTKIMWKGFCYEISSVSGNSINLKTAFPLILDAQLNNYVYHLEKYLKIIKDVEPKLSKTEKDSENNEAWERYLSDKSLQYHISSKENITLFKTLINKGNSTIFKKRINILNLIHDANNKIQEFSNFTIVDQCKFLEQFILLFSCNFGTVDFSAIGQVKNAGVSRMNKKIKDPLIFVSQSITGIYENKRRIEP